MEAADAAISRIESDPACARDKNLCPSVGRSCITRSEALLIGIVEIARDDTRAEPKAAHRVRKEHREIPTRSPSAIQSLGWRLSTLVVPALIADPARDAGTQVFQ